LFGPHGLFTSIQIPSITCKGGTQTQLPDASSTNPFLQTQKAFESNCLEA